MPNRTYVFAEYPQEGDVLPASMSGGGEVRGDLAAAQIAAGATGVAGVTSGNPGSIIMPGGDARLATRQYTWATLPAASAYIGNAFVSDIGSHGSLWRSDGSTWGLVGGLCVLSQSSVAVSAGAVTTEETLFSMTIPGGSMGPNGALRVTTLFTTTNSANTKTMRIKLGATAFAAQAGTTNATWENIPQTIRNRGSEASQVTFPAANAHTGTATGSAITTGTENTATDLVLAITGQKASAGEVLTLESYTIELIRP